MNQERLSFEAKIKQIDEQITILLKLKSQYAEKLNDLDKEETITSKVSNNNQPVADHALLLKDYFRGRDLERMFKRRLKTYKLLGYEIKN